MGLIDHKQNGHLDPTNLFLNIVTRKCSISRDEAEKTLISSDLLLTDGIGESLFPVFLGRSTIANNRLHIKLNDVLNPLLNQMLVRANDNDCKFII